MIIFPMVGASSRFSAAGYTLPKFMLKIVGTSVFQHIVRQFVTLAPDEKFVFVYRSDAFVENFIRAETKAAGLPAEHLELVALDEMTRGQADTVLKALENCDFPEDEQITIFNVDTIRLPKALPNLAEREGCDGFLEVFLGEGDHWSFADPADKVSLSNGGLSPVIAVAEKRRISDYCSDGLYIFRNAKIFIECFEASKSGLKAGEEMFVAPLFQDLIDGNREVVCGLIETSELHFAGTPDEFEALTALSSPNGLSMSPEFLVDEIYSIIRAGVSQGGYQKLMNLLASHPHLIGTPDVSQAISTLFFNYASFGRFVNYAYLTHCEHPSGPKFNPLRKPLEPIVFRCLNSMLTEGRYSSSAANLASFAILNFASETLKANSGLLQQALAFLDFPTHRLIFRRFRHKFTPKEVFSDFFTLEPPIVSVSYLFALYVISKRLDTQGRKKVEETLRSLLPNIVQPDPSGTEIANCHLEIMEAGLSLGVNKTLRKIRRRIKRKLPALKRPRVAVLLSGQMRNYLETKELFSQEWTEGFELDVFISTWDVRGMAPARLSGDLRDYHPSIREIIRRTTEDHAITPEEFDRAYHFVPEQRDVTKDELEKAFNTKWVEVDIEGKTTPSFSNNQERMFYKIAKAYSATKSQKTPYDAYIRMRPDLQIDISGSQISEYIHQVTKADARVVLRNTPLYDAQVPFVDDNFCIANPAGMDVYQSTFSEFQRTKRPCLGDQSTNLLKAHEALASWIMLNDVEIKYLPKDKQWGFSNYGQATAEAYIGHLENLSSNSLNQPFVSDLIIALRAKAVV